MAEITMADLQQSLLSIAAESYRVKQVFSKVLGKIPEDEQKRYVSQFAWFEKKVNSALEKAGYHIVDITGQPYDPGMAVTPLNLDDFGIEEILYVQQMIEPIIMESDHIIKTGTVLLASAFSIVPEQN